MTTTINLHPGAFKAVRYEAGSKHPPFACVEIVDGDVEAAIFLDTVASCDDLIKAAIAAKSMLLGETSDPVLADAHRAVQEAAAKHGRFDAASAAEVAQDVDSAQAANGDLAVRENEAVCRARSLPVWPGVWYVCTEPPGHDGDHVATDSTDTEVARWPQAAEVAEGVSTKPFHVTGTGAKGCGAEDKGWICTAQAGHAGPVHIAYVPGGNYTWPVASPLAPPAPYSTPAAEVPAPPVTEDDYLNGREPAGHLPQHQGSDPRCTLCGVLVVDGKHVDAGLPLPGRKA